MDYMFLCCCNYSGCIATVNSILNFGSKYVSCFWKFFKKEKTKNKESQSANKLWEKKEEEKEEKKNKGNIFTYR